MKTVFGLRKRWYNKLKMGKMTDKSTRGIHTVQGYI